MPDGAYLALNGLRTRLAELDSLAADLANVGTTGYKRARTSTYGSERATFDRVLQKATDPTLGVSKIDMRSGDISASGRDLDFAIEKNGFFEIETPNGTRYTRNGSFDRRSDGTLVTGDDMPVLGENGAIQLGNGQILVETDGTILVDGKAAGKLNIVDAEPGASISREGSSRFRIDNVTPLAEPRVRNKAMEHSNVSVVEAVAQLVSLSRGFDALQRGLVSLMSEVDGRAISELGRR